VEWLIGDAGLAGGGGGGGQPSAEVMYLRSQVLQMHCAMLYERHRREQHALRARKLMRQVYDTSAMEEKIKTLVRTKKCVVSATKQYLLLMILEGICTLSRKMTSFRQSENVIVL